MEEAVHPLTGMAVIHRNLDRVEKSTQKTVMKLKESKTKTDTLGGIIPFNRSCWGLTGWKHACRERAGGPEEQVEQESAVCP